MKADRRVRLKSRDLCQLSLREAFASLSAWLIGKKPCTDKSALRRVELARKPACPLDREKQREYDFETLYMNNIRKDG